MICAAVIVCRGHKVSDPSANTALKRQQWDNLSWFKRRDDAWFIKLQILTMEPWNHSPPPESISSKLWAANYRCCYWLSPQRGGLGKTHRRENACQDQAKEWSPRTWGIGHVGSLQESCSVSGAPHHFTASPGFTVLCWDPWPWLCFLK